MPRECQKNDHVLSDGAHAGRKIGGPVRARDTFDTIETFDILTPLLPDTFIVRRRRGPGRPTLPGLGAAAR
jgi:hypothetical protein